MNPSELFQRAPNGLGKTPHHTPGVAVSSAAGTGLEVNPDRPVSRGSTWPYETTRRLLREADDGRRGGRASRFRDAEYGPHGRPIGRFTGTKSGPDEPRIEPSLPLEIQPG
jgi:hypothetical protein